MKLNYGQLTVTMYDKIMQYTVANCNVQSNYIFNPAWVPGVDFKGNVD